VTETDGSEFEFVPEPVSGRIEDPVWTCLNVVSV
jgi:hypothetical protein